MKKAIEFKDLNFKLIVIGEIIGHQYSNKYNLGLKNYLKNDVKRTIDIEDEGYEIIPEVEEFYRNIEVYPDEVENIESIFQENADSLYEALCPFWDGEDDLFDVKYVDDVKFLPNLKSVTLFVHEDEDILDKFIECNIAAEWVS